MDSWRCSRENLPKQIWGRKDRGLRPDVAAPQDKFQVTMSWQEGSFADIIFLTD